MSNDLQLRGIGDSDDLNTSEATGSIPPDTEEDLYTSGDERATGGLATASAPKDIGTFNIKVNWTQQIPERWKAILEKALQTWAHETLSKVVDENCEIIQLQLMDNQCCAEVKIHPSKALDVIKTFKSDTLKLKIKKDKEKQTIVFFALDETMSPNETVSTVEEQKAGMSAGVIRNDPNEEENQGRTESSGAPPALTVPLSHYWYLSNAYRKELKKLEQDLDVQINADVSISINVKEKAKSVSVQKATRMFTDLYKSSTERLTCVHIPPSQMDSKVCKDVLCNIQTENTKMILNITADECQLFGPEKFLSGVQKRVNLEAGEISMPSTMMTNISDASRNEISRPFELDIKDSQDPLQINEIHWKLMKKTFEKQLLEIENKYGVKINGKTLQGSSTVMAQTRDDQLINLENHALRALMHLFQKFVLSTVTCPLQYPADKDTVAQAFNELHPQHNFVDVVETYGVWKLIGQPKHLGPAIAEIEKLVGKPVFEDKTKQMIGYQDFFPQASGLKWEQQEGGASGWEKTVSENGKANENDQNEKKEEKCPICMDDFTDKEKLKCGHEFCRECLKKAIKSLGETCPVCKDIFGELIGNQPDGKMTVNKRYYNLPGYPQCGTIEIDYFIPSGIQTNKHPNPTKYFNGTQRQAYLPDNAEGNHVLTLLKRAFEQKLIFTVGTSTTSGAENSVIWNDIHHKTSTDGGPQSYGYPDPDYLRRVKEELKAKGIE